MNAPKPPLVYDARWASELKRVLDQLAQRAHQRGQDLEMSDGRVILTSPNGTRYALEVANNGTLSTVAL